MSPRYWIKIALGAMVVFAIGMVFVGASRKGHAWADQVAHSATPISIPLVFVPFTFEGESIGSIKRLDIIREAPDRVTGAVVTVKLDQSAAMPAESCALAINDLDDIGDDATFYCADDATQAAEQLVAFGKVEFAPSGARRVLLLPAEVVEEIYDDLDLKVDASTRSAIRAEHKVQLEHVQRAKAHHEMASQEAVQAAEAAISIRIMDALNQAGFMLNADETGAVMSIRDGSTGNNLYMRADSQGFAMTMNEAGEPRMIMKADSNGFVLNVQGTDGAQVITAPSDN